MLVHWGSAVLSFVTAISPCGSNLKAALQSGPSPTAVRAYRYVDVQEAQLAVRQRRIPLPESAHMRLIPHEVAIHNKSYRIFAKLGQGKEGDVFLGLDESGLVVVVKVFAQSDPLLDHSEVPHLGIKTLGEYRAFLSLASLKFLQEQSFPVPQVIATDGATVVLEFVSGPTRADYLSTRASESLELEYRSLMGRLKLLGETKAWRKFLERIQLQHCPDYSYGFDANASQNWVLHAGHWFLVDP